ncbi:MAG: hypothetical protein A4E35_01678 [Methanoregula sp. PtaU1.Bin051]|nr:MAG: hypothetical protein A4E35_01678 [Methanoregula sp. PtaU1.Bin051]
MTKRKFRLLAISCIACILLAAFPALAADDLSIGLDRGTVIRGNQFVLTVTGKPGTGYYVWLAGTFSMTGAVDDQPPMIIGSTENVAQDPAGGPYVIGSYAYRNGNGRTIVQDVCPSSPAQYYAFVTTDQAGRGYVLFGTTSSTAPKQFTIRAEGLGDYDTDSISVVRGGVSITADSEKTATMETTVVTTLPTTTREVVTSPPATQAPTTTTKQAPAAVGFCLLGVALGHLCNRKMQ